jgi:hypothetical protein
VIHADERALTHHVPIIVGPTPDFGIELMGTTEDTQIRTHAGANRSTLRRVVVVTGAASVKRVITGGSQFRFGCGTPVAHPSSDTLVKGDANPYDPAYETYFAQREETHMQDTFRGTPTLRFLWHEQSGLCTGAIQQSLGSRAGAFTIVFPV